MRKLIFILLIPTLAFASLKDVQKQGIGQVNSYLTNGGCENGTAGWVESAGTLTADTTSPADGGASCKFVASGAQNVTKTVNISQGFRGKNALLYLQHKKTGGGVVVAISIEGESLDITLAQTTWTDTLIPFIAPAAATATITISAAAAETFEWDNVYVGRNYTFGEVKLESASITLGGSACAVRSGANGPMTTSDWIDSISWTSAGICVVTFKSGIWPNDPTCLCSGEEKTGVEYGCGLLNSATTTSGEFRVYRTDTMALVDVVFQMSCSGPR